MTGCDFYSPIDMQPAHRACGAACGHGALAACLEIPVMVALAVGWPGAGVRKGWVNMPEMEEAIGRHGRSFRVVGRLMPQDGVALLQWTGPWTKPGVPARVACMHRHWVAVRDGWVWDANLEAWLERLEWERFIPELLPPRSEGWAVARGYEVARTP